MNRKTLFRAALMFALVLCLVIPAGWAAEFIVKEGKPRAEIIIPEKPTRMQKLAAEELQKYVEKISGAKLAVTNAPGGDLPVKIYVGKSACTDKLGLDNKDLDHGAYLMKSGPDYLVLISRMQRPSDQPRRSAFTWATVVTSTVFPGKIQQRTGKPSRVTASPMTSWGTSLRPFLAWPYRRWAG